MQKESSGISQPNWDELVKEFNYTTSRSGGSGGQHVNKVETKVTVYFDIQASSLLTDEHKQLITDKYTKRIGKDGKISMYCQATRSQLKNKEKVTKNFIRLIKGAFKVRKKRKPTKVPKAVKLKNMENKRKRSKIKEMRKKPKL